MLLLILGLLVLLGTHAVTIVPGRRAALVERYGMVGFRAAHSLASVVGLALVVWGFGAYRASGYIPVWTPPVWFGHIALLINLPVFVLLAAAFLPGRIRAATKYPALLAVKIWATAHLVANGDLGSILLFGSFLAWAVAARISMKRRPDTPPPAPSGWNANDGVALGAGLALYAAMVFWLHPLLIGVPVLPGAFA